MFQKKVKKLRLVTAIFLILALLTPLTAGAAPGDDLYLASIEANGLTVPLPSNGGLITFAEKFPAGSAPVFYLHFNQNVTYSEVLYNNLGKIHLYNADFSEMLYNYETTGNNSVIGLRPGTSLNEGKYSIVVDSGITGGREEARYSSQRYEINFVAGNIDLPPPADPDLKTYLVSFEVSGVVGTPYSILAKNTATGEDYFSANGLFDLPDGSYSYAVSASGYTTAQGTFSVNGAEVTGIRVAMSNTVTVTFVTSPSDATVTLKIGQNDFITPVGDKRFQVQPGLEYTYVVLREGYLMGSSRFSPISNLTLNVALESGEDGQGNGGNTLILISPKDNTLGEKPEYYNNVINKAFAPAQALDFQFVLSAGVNSFNEQNFRKELLPLIGIYDKYPGGSLVSKLDFLSFDSAEKAIKIGLPAGKLQNGKYCLVFGRDICGNNENKTLGKDVVFEFAVGEGNGSESDLSDFTVTFDPAGGSEVSQQTIKKGELVEKPADPARQGFKFVAWFLEGLVYDFAVPVTKNLTLTAQWEDNLTGVRTLVTEQVPLEIVRKTLDAFEDIPPEGAWYSDAVAFVLEQGLFRGTSEREFSPDLAMDRGMFVTVLSRLAGNGSTGEAQGLPFHDVQKDDYYARHLAWAYENGLVTGYDDGSFGAGQLVTRQEAVTLFYRYAAFRGYNLSFGDGGSLAGFTDAAALWARGEMNWAVNVGFIKGRTATTLNPDDSSTRAEVAALVQRFVSLFMK